LRFNFGDFKQKDVTLFFCYFSPNEPTLFFYAIRQYNIGVTDF